MKVKIDGLDVAFRGTTTGKPVVVAIHGAGGGAWMWEPLREAAGGAFDLLAIDLPGHGDSTGDGETTVSKYRDIVRKACSAAGIKKPFAMGHSMGGAIVQDWAATAPDELSGIILVSTGARLKVHPMIFEAIAKNFEGYVAMSRKMAFGAGTPESVLNAFEVEQRKAKPEIAAGDFRACDAFDSMSKIEGIRLKTLVVCGSADAMTPSKYSQFLASKIAGSELKIFEGAGHTLPIERPSELAETIGKFVEASGKARSA